MVRWLAALRRATGTRSPRCSSATTTGSTASAVRVLGDVDEAADLAQEVCVALPAKLASYGGRSRFTTWLYSVVVNAARDVLRRRAARRRGERGYAELDALLRGQAAARECESVWLRQALACLSDDLRVTVVLVLEGGLASCGGG